MAGVCIFLRNMWTHPCPCLSVSPTTGYLGAPRSPMMRGKKIWSHQTKTDRRCWGVTSWIRRTTYGIVGSYMYQFCIGQPQGVVNLKTGCPELGECFFVKLYKPNASHAIVTLLVEPLFGLHVSQLTMNVSKTKEFL